MNSATRWDIAIIGAGGAGLTAAIYAARSRRATILFERAVPGGQIATAGLVENYPGFPDGIEGADLAQAMLSQVDRHGARFVSDEVLSIAVEGGGGFRLNTADMQHAAATVIATAGAAYRHLGVPGEEDLTGRGVSYCATCDGPFFRGQDVAVVGGGDAAVDEAILLTRYARRVTVIHRGPELRASRLLQERARANPQIGFLASSTVERILGAERVEGLEVRSLESGLARRVDVAGVFVFIGQVPNSHLLKGLTELDPGGHAVVDLEMRTAVPGLFVAGDLRTKSPRQLVTACGDGAAAALAADRYLSSLAR